MTNRNRIIIAAASLLLVVMYFTPLWRISLEAPQYPEGLGLNIMLDTIEGQNFRDLEKINNLNHYIGMQQIVPEAIPELKIMPWLIAFLIGTGLIVAISGKRRLLYAWAGFFVLISIVGMVDFWLWEYDYGHNLNTEEAAIIVPGMSYQPPLIGSKDLLNFTAHSWPGIGGWIAIGACLVGVLIAVDSFRRNRGAQTSAAKSTSSPRALAGVAAAALLLTATGCDRGPQPFHLGVDQGEYCRMVIDDARFASQIVTSKGRAIKFDAIECMLSYAESREGELEGAEYWVSDFADPDRLVRADDAVFVRSPAINSPMSAGLAAFAPVSEAEGDSAAHPAAWAETGENVQILTWTELRALDLADTHQSPDEPARESHGHH